jgi:diacylglycerol O-acyltransferase-1
MFLWMIAFYGIFHCLLNAMAEISRFADREFYLEWWDATCMSEFWKMWNRAVYKWMCRHVYVESQRQVKFFNNTLAAISTYVVTAIMHEYLLSIAFVMFRPWFFAMIIAQSKFHYYILLTYSSLLVLYRAIQGYKIWKFAHVVGFLSRITHS